MVCANKRNHTHASYVARSIIVRATTSVSRLSARSVDHVLPNPEHPSLKLNPERPIIVPPDGPMVSEARPLSLRLSSSPFYLSSPGFFLSLTLPPPGLSLYLSCLLSTLDSRLPICGEEDTASGTRRNTAALLLRSPTIHTEPPHIYQHCTAVRSLFALLSCIQPR